MAVLVMACCIILSLERERTRMNKIFGTKLVFLAGSCNSRWRPAAILKYGFAAVVLKITL